MDTHERAADGLCDELGDVLFRLELALAQRREADLPGGYDGVIDAGFREIGASGRSWTRREILDALATAEPSDVAIDGFEIETLAPGVVLATYQTTGIRRARRASLWMRDGDRWRVRYHQGTLL